MHLPILGDAVYSHIDMVNIARAMESVIQPYVGPPLSDAHGNYGQDVIQAALMRASGLLNLPWISCTLDVALMVVDNALPNTTFAIHRPGHWFCVRRDPLTGMLCM
jgi:hypothetical protein